jgi:hypothetical protein
VLKGEGYLGELPEASFRFPNHYELLINLEISALSCFQLGNITTPITNPEIIVKDCGQLKKFNRLSHSLLVRSPKKL